MKARGARGHSRFARWWCRCRSTRREALCRRVLAGLGEERPTAAINALSVVTPRSRRSTGTVVQVQLAVATGGTRVEIAAWPGAQLFDWGVSRRLVQEVVDGLGRTLPGSSASRV